MRHYRLTYGDALRAHTSAIEGFGGRTGVLRENNVLSALGRPYSGYFRSIAAKGSALIEAINRNHGFVDGNKRTSALLLFLLLERSGYSLVSATPDEDIEVALEQMIYSVAEGTIDRAGIEAWLLARCRSR